MGVNITPKTTDTDQETKAPSFLKFGAAAAEAAKKASEEAAAKQSAANAPFRFFITKEDLNKDFTITFLDGDIDESLGDFAGPYWHEHFVMVNSRPRNIVCLKSQGESECPLCQAGVPMAGVRGFTVIDHTKVEGKEGKVYQHTRKLFVAKPTVMKKLHKIAMTQKSMGNPGLKGATVVVTRTDAQQANTGDMFQVVGFSTPEQLMAKYGIDKDNVTALNYEEALAECVVDKKTLIGMGYGAGTSTIGASAVTGSVGDVL